jgi:hypothetical protein
VKEVAALAGIAMSRRMAIALALASAACDAEQFDKLVRDEIAKWGKVV